jgi:hypothetical protein
MRTIKLCDSPLLHASATCLIHALKEAMPAARFSFACSSSVTMIVILISHILALVCYTLSIMKFKGMPKFRFDIAQKLVPIPGEFRQTASGVYMPASNLFNTAATPEPAPETPPEPPYEVNMMEALVGWKSWDILESGNLDTRGYIWPVDAPIVAECVYKQAHQHTGEIPSDRCSCGIYAADSKEGAIIHNRIVGLLYGWGRYVRGTNGWRAQYAYPKCFYLTEDQFSYIDALKKYHVPIYIAQPILIYNPEEDGYEHRGEEENWNLRTIEESATAEEDDADY